MDRNKNAVAVVNNLSAINVETYSLIRLVVPLEVVIEKINEVLEEVIGAKEVTLLSEDLSGLVSDRHIRKLGAIRYDGFRRVVRYKGHRVDLSPTSALLMSMFMNKPGLTITHQEFVDRVYPEAEPTEKPAVMCRTIIHRIRDDLAELPGGEAWIETVRGTGYVFVG